MKTLLAAVCFCLLLTTAHAQTWPRNPKTGKVEFTGMLPWPATVKTEAQRRALVRRWYLAKLTDSTPQEVEQDARTVVSPTLLTYAGLPVVVVVRYGEGDEGTLVGYKAQLIPQPKGLRYTLSGFNWERSGSVQAASTPAELESIIKTPTQEQAAVLTQARQRFANAAAGW